MTPEETDNAARAIAKKIITELNSKSNKLTFRQLLHKYASQAKPFCPKKHEPWLWLCVIVHRVVEGK
ncbi:hypothetical protein [Serratia sp. M24T3]|uniref:hypothetical protein n=1 Tax=Serratia sp. M24T3 TaxID=932213 RepID=UPI00025B9EE4|nr:hypothetical protein [Serratia sp. M24T3]EIC86080.1 hypothetical protein SPM24T3_01743 [Serratia sp. M24T3]